MMESDGMSEDITIIISRCECGWFGFISECKEGKVCPKCNSNLLDGKKIRIWSRKAFGKVYLNNSEITDVRFFPELIVMKDYKGYHMRDIDDYLGFTKFENFKKWIAGQTVGIGDNGEVIVYEDDFKRFMEGKER
jgi:hypothetical protein